MFFVAEVSMLIYKMSGFKKMTIRELKVVAKAISMDNYENMSNVGAATRKYIHNTNYI